MQRSDLRDQLKQKIQQEDAAFTDATLNAFLNEALRHVAAGLATGRANLMLYEADLTISNPTSDRYVQPTMPTDYPLALGIAWAEATDASFDNGYGGLEIVDYAHRHFNVPKAATKQPSVWLHNGAIGLNRPEDGLTITVAYWPAIREMAADGDTPGENNGNGTANLIPEQAQHLITSFAAVLALASENAEIQAWQAVYEQQLAAIIGMYALSEQSPTKGN